MDNRINVGININGVLAGMMSAAIEILNRDRGLSLIETDIPRRLMKADATRWGHDLFGSSAEMHRCTTAAWNEGYIQPEEPGISDSLGMLTGHHCDITIISSCNMVSYVPVLRWLLNQGYRYQNLVLLRKAEDKLSYPIDILIDDSPLQIMTAEAYPDKILLLRDQPWNRSALYPFPPNVKRVSSLKEAAINILSMKQIMEYGVGS